MTEHLEKMKKIESHWNPTIVNHLKSFEFLILKTF